MTTSRNHPLPRNAETKAHAPTATATKERTSRTLSRRTVSPRSRLPLAATATALALGVLVGCSKDEARPVLDEQVQIEFPDANPNLAFPDSLVLDSWVLQEGSLLSAALANTRVTAFDLEGDGRARIYFHDLITNARDCVRAFALFDGRTLALDLGREPNLVSLAGRAEVFPIVVVDEDFMGIANGAGHAALLARQPVPGGLQCEPLPIVRRWNGLPQPSYFTDIVPLAGNLVYTSNDRNLEQFDPNTGTMGPSLGSSTGRHIQSVQSGQFWSHCGCGGSPDAYRHDTANTYDVVSTDDLSEQIAIRGAAYDPASGHLWLHGPTSNETYYFYEVDANAEPDVLVRRIWFPRPVRALAFHGSEMWAIGGRPDERDRPDRIRRRERSRTRTRCPTKSHSGTASASATTERSTSSARTRTARECWWSARKALPRSEPARPGSSRRRSRRNASPKRGRSSRGSPRAATRRGSRAWTS
ncbi:MAG: hypothetical protein R3E97_09365 [Candidatus Eisenbacteria bacterium]